MRNSKQGAPMTVIVIGGSGTIGSAVVKELSTRHKVITAGRSSGDMTVDLTSEPSIRQMFDKAGKFHAVVVTAGAVHFDNLDKMTADKYRIGLDDKLMGQVNAVLIGKQYIQDGGSFTLTSGILSHDPIKSGSSASMVNAAIDGFVRGVAIELPRSIRINAISPTVLTESMDKYGSYFRGYIPVSAVDVAQAYCKSVEGLQTGQIYRVGY